MVHYRRPARSMCLGRCGLGHTTELLPEKLADSSDVARRGQDLSRLGPEHVAGETREANGEIDNVMLCHVKGGGRQTTCLTSKIDIQVIILQLVTSRLGPLEERQVHLKYVMCTDVHVTKNLQAKPSTLRGSLRGRAVVAYRRRLISFGLHIPIVYLG